MSNCMRLTLLTFLSTLFFERLQIKNKTTKVPISLCVYEACTHECVKCAWVWGPEVNINVFPQWLSILLFLRQTLWSPSVLAGWELRFRNLPTLPSDQGWGYSHKSSWAFLLALKIQIQDPKVIQQENIHSSPKQSSQLKLLKKEMYQG